MNQVPADVADAFLKVKLHEAADIYATSKPPSVQELIQTSGKIDPTPWFSLYRDAFFRLQSFGEHEMMDYPVACETTWGWYCTLDSFHWSPFCSAVLNSTPAPCVAGMLALPSSTTGDFVSAFENLYKSAPHPSLLDAGVMDSRVLRYYIIVHDRRLSKTEDLERYTRASLARYSFGCIRRSWCQPHTLPLAGLSSRYPTSLQSLDPLATCW